MRFRLAAAVLSLLLASLARDAHAQRAPITLRRVGQWGCMACTTGQQFGGIAALAVTRDGTTYVVDRDEPRVRVFDSTGALIRAFGRTGSGPGELQVPVGIAVAPGGSMQIPDLRNARLTRFTPTGEPVATVPLTRMPTTMAHHPSRPEIWLAFTDFRRGGEVERWRPADSSGTLLARLTDFPPTEGVAGTVHSLAVAPDGGFAIGDGIREYRIRRFDAAGRPAGADIVRDIPRTEKTAEEIAEQDARMAERGAQMRATLEGRSAGAGAGLRMPAVAQLRNYFDYFALRFDEAGRLWVRTGRGARGSTIFDLFDPSGRFLGEVELPVQVRAYDLAGELLATAIESEDGVPMIAVWRVR